MANRHVRKLHRRWGAASTPPHAHNQLAAAVLYSLLDPVRSQAKVQSR